MEDSCELNAKEGGNVSFFKTTLPSMQASTASHIHAELIVFSLDRRALYRCFILAALRQHTLPLFYVPGAIRVVRSVFNSYGTASFVSNEAQIGGAI